jgi:hypothetical protein
MIQKRAPQHDILHGPGLFRNGIQYLQEPLGGIAVWNGQFEQPGFDRDENAGGWEYYPDDATSIIERVTAGHAGHWCLTGGNSLAGHLSGYALSLVYIPIDVSRNYALKGSFIGSEEEFATVRFGVACYDTAQIFLGNSLAMLDVAPGTSWVNYDFVLGTDGMDIFQPGTRYARIYIFFQTSLFAGANSRVWADNIFFGPYDVKEGHITFTVDGLGSEI